MKTTIFEKKNDKKMLHKFNPTFILLLVLLVGLVACEKNEDTELPHVQIVKPTTNSSYSVPDSIMVEATISDNNNIEWIQIDLINKDQQPVADTRIIKNINQTSYQLQLKYPVTDEYLPSGEYYLQVKAFDGINSKNDQKKIHINEVPRELKYFFLLTKSNPNQVSVYYLDSSWQKHYIFAETFDYLASRFISRTQQLVITGESTYGIKSYEIQNFDPLWNIPVTANPTGAYFTAFSKTDQEILMALYNGDIAIINDHGNRIKTFHAALPYFAYELLKYNNYLLTAQRNKPDNERYITSYFINGGGTYHEQFIDFRVEQFYAGTNNNIILTGNYSNEGGIWVYNLLNKTLWDAKAFSESPVKSSCKISSNDFLISGDQNIHRYQVSTNSLTVWKNNISADKLYYEPLSNNVIAIKDKTIRIFDFPIPTLKHETVLNEKIQAIHPVYNK